MRKKLLTVKNLKQYYPGKGGVVKANDGITLDIYEGETLGLVGESGCGKSTLGRSILQLNPPTSGDVIYYGRSVEEMHPAYVRRTYHQLGRKQRRIERLKTRGLTEQAEEEQAKIAALIGGLVCIEDWRALERAGRHWWKGNGKPLEQLRRNAQKSPDYAKYEAMKEDGISLTRLTGREMRSLCKDLQIVFQDPYSSLNPKMTVGQLIGEGVGAHGIVHDKKELESYLLNVMEKCGLSPYMLQRYPHQFSGGQRQRIGIARSLALKPRFLVCDEAVSALDVSIQAQIINLLIDRRQEENLTYLFISHDFSVIRYVSERIGVMYLGKIVELASASQIFDHPMHPYTLVLLSAIPSVDEVEREQIEMTGEPPKPQNPPSGCRFHTRCKYCTTRCETEEPMLREVEEGHMTACHYAEEIFDNMGSV